MSLKAEFLNINQFVYTNLIAGIASLLSSLVIIILSLNKKELKENNYTIFACIAVSNVINSLTQFFCFAFINYEQSTVNKTWYANIQRVLNHMNHFSYAYYSLYYFYYIYERVTTFKKNQKYLYHILIGIFIFTLSSSVLFVIFFNINTKDDAIVTNFNGLFILNSVFSIDDVQNNGIVQMFYYIVFFPPLFAYLIIINKLRIKLSKSLKDDQAHKTMFLKRFYDLLMFLIIFGILNLVISILYDTFENSFRDHLIKREVYYLRIELLFSYLTNILATLRGVIYFFIFLIDDKVSKLVTEYIDNNHIIKKFKKIF